ncbi:MAG: molybdopterin-dependent oxidoreductase [Acidimicrobiia bacterium]
MRSVPLGRAALAGAVAGAVGLGASELLAGIAPAIPSLVVGIGRTVIEFAPAELVHLAISLFGTSDKAVLLAGLVVLSVAAGGGLGAVAASRPSLAGRLLIALGALLVVLVGRGQGASIPYGALGATVAIATAVVAFRFLVARAGVGRPDQARPPLLAGPAPAPVVERRGFLFAGVGFTAAAVLAGGAGRWLRRNAYAAVARARIVLPRPAKAAPPLAEAASFDVPGITPLITPNHRFYRIDNALVVPGVDPENWSLRVHGRVDRPFELSFEELLALPMVEEHVTLACVSNDVGGDLVGTARWLGTPLAALLERAGVQPGTDQVVGRAVDGFTVGFPLDAAIDGRVALVAVGMNGEPLPIIHGFPARLVVAGLYGYVSATKWLSEIELSTFDEFDAYWIPRGWARKGPVRLQSRIDVPRGGRTVTAGRVAVAGVAWAPTMGIGRVEVQVDEGPWHEARLAEAVNPQTWRQWVFEWEATRGTHRLRVRAIDGLGQLQDARERVPRPDGATGYHAVKVRVLDASPA